MGILFPHRPDWARGIKHELKFKTEIIESRSFREQRIAERIQPRRKVSFDVAILREGEGFEAYWAKKLQGTFDMPDWTRWVTLTAPAAIDSFDLTVDAVPGWLILGQRILLVSTGQQAAYTVSAFGTLTLTTSTDRNEAWPVGTRVYPMLEGVVDQDVRGTILTDRTWKGAFQFAANPGSFAEPDTTAPLTFNGRELWLLEPNWVAGLPENIQGYLETVDFDRGVVDHFSPVERNQRRLQVNYMLKTNARAEAFIEFFCRCKGQRGEFYSPTWQPDVSLSIGAASASTRIDVPGLGFYENYAGSGVYKAIIALFKDGTYQANRITSVTISGPNSRINLASAWSRAINATTTRKVCLLPVWRFATDDVTMEWWTNQVAECKTAFQTLEDL